MTIFFIILISSFIATALSSMSGGGASMINIPVMLSLGIPFPMATAAQKVGSAAWVLPASYNYLKDKKIDWKFLSIFSFIGLIGAYYGTLLIISLDARTAEIVVGTLILSLVVYVAFKKDIGLREKKIHSAFRQSLAYLFAFILGFYESFFGAGNGIVFSVITFHTKGFDFIDALGYYFAIAFLWEILIVAIFIYNGYFSWAIMVPTAIGSVAGGYVGSKYGKFKGNKFIKITFLVVGSVLGLKLLLGY